MTLRILRWGNYPRLSGEIIPDYLGGPKIIMELLVSGRQEGRSQRRTRAEENRVQSQREVSKC